MKRYYSLLVLPLLFACSSGQILSTESTDNIDFTSYKTYSFPGLTVETEKVLFNFDDKLQLIIEAIDKEMAARGYTKSGVHSDLLVNVGLVVEERIQTRETDIREAPVYYGTRNYSWQTQEVAVGTYRVGTVTIDVVDLKTSTMIWQGVAESVINEKRSLEKARKNIYKIMDELFDKYPVKSTQI